MKLEVWQRSIDLAVAVYRCTGELPNEEKFGLRSQMRRAAVSIVSNVAEGEGRRSRKDHARFYLNARGSLYELQTQIAICERLGYFDAGVVQNLITGSDRAGRLISGMLRFLSRVARREPPDAN